MPCQASVPVIDGRHRGLKCVLPPASPPSPPSRPLSLLVLGRPGMGKTTLLRDIARLLSLPAHQGGLGRSVIIVDTSNEIAGKCRGFGLQAGHVPVCPAPVALQGVDGPQFKYDSFPRPPPESARVFRRVDCAGASLPKLLWHTIMVCSAWQGTQWQQVGSPALRPFGSNILFGIVAVACPSGCAACMPPGALVNTTGWTSLG